MRTAAFISYIFFFFFALLGVVSAAPEPVQVGSILARDVDTTPAEDGLAGLIARGDDDHHNDYCWKKDGWSKCGKWNSCCKKYQTCCGGNKCCDKGYKCVRKGHKDDHDDDDDHHKRGDDDHHGGGKWGWYCKKSHWIEIAPNFRSLAHLLGSRSRTVLVYDFS
ncbi:unnamed protein product [Rhizoctonia solani]|uniref:Granulins domain-containing protein n=1 Tax=Rhizoctonia solani TaxID=456999 RepID=A0A8H3HP64_9AGAM|nr:unnamed protein product [Rhizoctonia solani]CAE7144692.1 unnamed protein product [Rhizoctonia solani]